MRPDLTAVPAGVRPHLPGRNRFGDHPAQRAVDIVISWLVLLASCCCAATPPTACTFQDILTGAITPVLQMVAGGRRIQRWRAREPARRTAVVVARRASAQRRCAAARGWRVGAWIL